MTNADRHEDGHEPDGLGGLVRRVLSSGLGPEERLEELLAERRRELDEHAARFDASIADLERREDLLRDSRTSVERMLRLRTSDLEARESELTDFLRELSERESRLSHAEEDLARRRGDLGAVELRRAAVERRERAVAMREERLEELDSEIDDTGATGCAEPLELEPGPQLAFVPGADYRLAEIEQPGLAAGDAVELEGEDYLVTRVGHSPLPGDSRRCAYLVRGPSDGSPFGSS
jgi:hypothetical protein